MNPPSVLANEAAISIGHYCSTRFQVAGTDNDVHPMLDIPWFAEAIQKAIDEGAAENTRLVAKIADLEKALGAGRCRSCGALRPLPTPRSNVAGSHDVQPS